MFNGAVIYAFVFNCLFKVIGQEVELTMNASKNDPFVISSVAELSRM